MEDEKTVTLYEDDWSIIIDALDCLLEMLKVNENFEAKVGEISEGQEKDTIYVLSSVINQLKQEVEEDAE